MHSLAEHIIVTIAIKVSTTGIIIGIQFGVTFVEEMNAFLIKKKDTMQSPKCNAPCHSTSCLNEHHARKNGNKSLCKTCFFVPIAKLNCTITK